MSAANPSTDSVVDSVVNKFRTRSAVGLQKYGTTLDREDLTLVQWLDHAQEEHMDAILYLEKIRKIESERNQHADTATTSQNINLQINTIKENIENNCHENHEYTLLFPEVVMNSIEKQNKELNIVLSFCLIPILLFIIKYYIN